MAALRLAMFGALLLSTLSSAETPNHWLHGVVVVPEGVPRPADIEVRLSLDTGSQLGTGVGADGKWALDGVPPGTHLLDVFALGLLFPSVRLEVAGDGGVAAAAADVPGNPPLGYPLVLGPVARQDYYERRAGFSLLGFLKTPYGIMIAFMLFSMYVMPRLKVDPEEYKEMLAEKDKLVGTLTGRGGGSGDGEGKETKKLK